MPEVQSQPSNIAQAAREIEAVDAQLNAVLAVLDAAGERPVMASHMHVLLQPIRTILCGASTALNEFLGH